MKIITIITLVVGALVFSVSALTQDEQASRHGSRLAPRSLDPQVPTKTLITRNDNDEKDFTHDELFTLQKKFLDNFVAPNNAIQVSCSAPDVRSTT